MKFELFSHGRHIGCGYYNSEMGFVTDLFGPSHWSGKFNLRVETEIEEQIAEGRINGNMLRGLVRWETN